MGVSAPLSGNVYRINVASGDPVKSGDVVLVLEAMKMETEIRASSSGHVDQVRVSEGDAVKAGDTLITLAD